MKKYCLGVDTSNYTTSLCLVCNGEVISSVRRLLPVKEGEKGLRQSDAVFLHTKALPELSEELFSGIDMSEASLCAVGVSDRPRDAQGSYMPCFLAGISYASAVAHSHNIPMFDGVGEDSIARDDVFVSYNRESEHAYFEFAQAFGMDFLKSAVREFFFQENKITMKDAFVLDCEKEITERFVSIIEPKIVDGVAVIEDVALEVKGKISPKITVKQAEKHLDSAIYNVYLIDYVLPKGQTNFEIEFKM